MTPSLLLDTHVVNRLLLAPKRLSKEQRRVIEAASRRREPLAVSCISLMEFGYLSAEGRLTAPLPQIFATLETPMFQLLPLNFEVAAEIPPLINVLRDPVDTAIVATARAYRLQLLTLDRRIIDSKLVSIID